MQRVKHYFHKKSLLVKMLLTVVGLICIPLVGMQLVIVSRSTEQLKITNDEHYFDILQTNANSLNARIDYLSTTAMILSVDDLVVKPLSRNATDYSVYAAAKHLSDVQRTIPFDCSVGVFYYDENHILFETFEYRMDFFLKRIAENSLECMESLREHLLLQESLSFFSTQDYLSGGYLFVTKPVSLVSVGKDDAAVFFVLDLSEISEMFRSGIVNDSSFAILDNQGQCLLRDGLFLEGKEFVDAITLAESDKTGMDSGNGYNIYKYTDPSNNWTYLLSVEKSTAEQTLMEYMDGITLLVLLTLFLAVAMISLTVYINYRPIHRMIVKHTNQRQSEKMSELELIDSTFFALDKKITNQKNLLLSFSLSDLLSGAKVEQEMITQHFPTRNYSALCIAVMHCPKLSVEQETAIIEAVKAQTNIDHIVVTGVADNPEQIFVCMAEKPINSVMLRESLLLALQHQEIYACRVNVGFPVSEIGSLRLSFLDALTADITQPEENVRIQNLFPTEDVQNFVKAVYLGEEQNALSLLQKVETIFYRDIVGSRMERYFDFKLLSAYVTAIKDHGTALSQEEIKELVDVEDSCQTFANLRKSLRLYCYRITALEKRANKQIQRKLIQYVNEHYWESDICLNSAADHLNTSIYTVSKLFKEATGQGFKEYITNKRLDYAAEQLIQGDENVVEIAMKAGFENAAYFSAVFKSRFGMPPSKYRKINRE